MWTLEINFKTKFSLNQWNYHNVSSYIMNNNNSDGRIRFFNFYINNGFQSYLIDIKHQHWRRLSQLYVGELVLQTGHHTGVTLLPWQRVGWLRYGSVLLRQYRVPDPW